jgi:hypothetical protein
MAVLAAPENQEAAELVSTSSFGFAQTVFGHTVLPAPQLTEGAGGDDSAVGYAS